MTEYKSIKLEDKELVIHYDEYAESPREWDNLGTMAIFHRRYDFGDKVDFASSDFNSWGEMENHIWKNLNAAVVLPIYMYDHIGITINTTGFSCQWDSGQVGFIYATKKNIKEWFNVKRVSEQLVRKVTEILEGEVKDMDTYLTGDVYGFELYKLNKCDQGHEHKELIDSCSGFFGDNFVTNGLLDHCGELTDDERKFTIENL